MRAWVAASGLSPDRFAETLLGTHADAPGIGDLRAAAATVATATTQRQMWAASDHLAAGMTAIRLEDWPRFVASAASRAASLSQDGLVVQVQSGRGVPPGSGARRGGFSPGSLSTAELFRMERHAALVRQITTLEPQNPTALGMRQLNTAPSAELVARLETELLAVQARKENAPFMSLRTLVPPPVRNQRSAARNEPGIAHTSTLLQPADRYWLLQCYKEEGAPVPAQIARALNGRHFSEFSALRAAFWREVRKTPDIAESLTPGQDTRIDKDRSPNVEDSTLMAGARMRLELDHEVRIKDGGPVYDFSNIRVRTPRSHIDRDMTGDKR